MLDRFIVPVPYDESGHAGKSWHPKVCIARYRPADPGLINNAVETLAWQPHFTKDDSWDLALFLSSAVKGGNTVPGVRDVTSRLAQKAAQSAAWAPLLDQLDGVTWDVPRGKSVLAVAPFLDVTSLKSRMPTACRESVPTRFAMYSTAPPFWPHVVSSPVWGRRAWNPYLVQIGLPLGPRTRTS
jgi:hypothetical protein